MNQDYNAVLAIQNLEITIQTRHGNLTENIKPIKHGGLSLVVFILTRGLIGDLMIL